eukprot:scaffold122804_cov37-Tisochrysis_lutea.AAC.2
MLGRMSLAGTRQGIDRAPSLSRQCYRWRGIHTQPSAVRGEHELHHGERPLAARLGGGRVTPLRWQPCEGRHAPRNQQVRSCPPSPRRPVRRMGRSAG